MENNDCALLINSCDAYQDILNTFFELLKRFWPDLPYNIFLSTESLDYTNNSFKINNIHPVNHNCTWSERIADALKKINSNYIILMLDDFFLYDTVNTKKIENCLDYMKRNNKIATFTFFPLYMESINCKYDGFKKKERNSKNKVNAILGMWNKQHLLKYLDGYKENIWEWEKNATYRSNTLYPKDEFYVMKKNSDNIFPYNLSKYGLFSGKWLKPTKELFNQLGVAINFDKRGFYDEALSGLEQSIISSFKMESAVIPYFKLNHKGTSYIKYKEFFSSGYFKQEYKIIGATNIIRWEPSVLWGFSISNLKINIIYKDNSTAVVDSSTLFGSFFKADNIYVFNNNPPFMYIPTIKDKIISKLIIEGYVNFPLSKDLLIKAFNKETLSYNKNDISLSQELYNEFLVSKEKLYHIDINSKIDLKLNNGMVEKNIKYNQKLKNNWFKQSFMINNNQSEVFWVASQDIGFAIKNFKILLHMNNGLYKYIPTNKIDGLPEKINNLYVFLNHYIINFKIPNNVKEIIILGKFICPVKSSILNKIIYKNKS